MVGRSFHDIINHSMAAVFIDLCSLAVGAEYEILQFLVLEHTLLTCAVMLDPQDSLPDCWGDQGSCELALVVQLAIFPRSLVNRTSS